MANKRRKPQADVIVRNGGSVFLLTPVRKFGQEWVDEHVQYDAHQLFGSAIVVEHRYIEDIANGMIDAGLHVIAR